MTTYKDAGVDLKRADEFIERVRGMATITLTNNVIAQVGGFAGCFELPEGYKKPVLVTSTDGVGTKLQLAKTEQHLHNIGIDLVAMVVNDIICCGAKPLFFLDYYATSKLDPKHGEAIISGIAEACLTCGISLIGGETAELPGLYKPKDFDLAGFGVGIVEKENIIDGHNNVECGDKIIGIGSSGPHANGYSLIREIIRQRPFRLFRPVPYYIMNRLTASTVLYSPIVEKVLEKHKVKGIANITGGGLVENLPRIVDSWFRCNIDANSWPVLPVFDWIQEKGRVPLWEMHKVFNMGIGMVLIVAPEDEDEVLHTIGYDGYDVWTIGEVEKREDVNKPAVNFFHR